jgi:uncharacterized protein YdeI (BOF family)
MAKKKLLASVMTVLSLVAVSVVMFGVPAFAAPISEIIASPVSDTEVSITGTVTSVDGNDFVVSDGTEIAVEAGPTWYQAIDVAVGDNVTVTGEVDTGKDGTATPVIEAFSITITLADGTSTEITVREEPGKPPWAGGPNVSGPPNDSGDQDDEDDGSTVTGQPGSRAGGVAFSEPPGNRAGGPKK